MRVGFPVIFIRNGKEYAGVTVTSSPKLEQVPTQTDRPLTRQQLFGELRCSIAFWDTEIRGWRQADDVPYLSIELAVPAEGDFYSEVGAPDPQERAAAAADAAERLARARAETPVTVEGALAAPEIRSPDPVDEEPRMISEGGPASAAIRESQGAPIASDRQEFLAGAQAAADEIEARPIG